MNRPVAIMIVLVALAAAVYSTCHDQAKVEHLEGQRDSLTAVLVQLDRRHATDSVVDRARQDTVTRLTALARRSAVSRHAVDSALALADSAMALHDSAANREMLFRASLVHVREAVQRALEDDSVRISALQEAVAVQERRVVQRDSMIRELRASIAAAIQQRDGYRAVARWQPLSLRLPSLPVAIGLVAGGFLLGRR